METDAIRKLLLEQQERFKSRLHLINQIESFEKENRREAIRLGTQGVQDETLTVSTIIKDHSQQLLEQTQASLSRLECGSYGICIKCEHAIEEARLRLLPTTTVCSRCK